MSKRNSSTRKNIIDDKKIEAPVSSVMDDKRFEFLNLSVTDIQNVIRAIDTKVGFLLVFLGIPVSALSKIYNVFYALFTRYDLGWWKFLVLVYVSLFVIAWGLSFLTAVRVLTSIHNPNAHIKDAPKNYGSFYAGGLFKLTYKELFISRKALKSNISFAEFANKSPQNREQVINELIFEQMKLAYIRDIKIFRQNWAFIFTLTWLLIGFIGQISYLFTKNS
ncbi:MAG TPA: hypothetical protein VF596_13335 [Pyrinomonadaceae bacterium]|jgi:hypothetical protein